METINKWLNTVHPGYYIDDCVELVCKIEGLPDEIDLVLH